MEFLLALFFTPAFILGMLIFALLAEHNNSRGWAGFWFLLLLLAGYGLLDLSVGGLIFTACAWIPVGIAWSMWRWKRHCSGVVKQFKAEKMDKWAAEGELDLSKHTGAIVYYVYAWPVSMVQMILSDLIDLIETLVVDVFKRTYSRMSESARSQLVSNED